MVKVDFHLEPEAQRISATITIKFAIQGFSKRQGTTKYLTSYMEDKVTRRKIVTLSSI